MFNRLRAIWPKSYQRGSFGKSYQNGILREDNFFALLVLRDCRSGGSSLGFRAGSLLTR